MATKKPSQVINLEIMTSDDYDRDADREGVIVTVYGEEGAGKTVALANLPAASTLVIGFDTGVKVLKRMRLGHRLVQIQEDLGNLDAVIDLVRCEDETSPLGLKRKEMFPEGIKFLVVDHVTQMFEFLTNGFADRRDHFIRTLKDAGDTNAAMKRYLSIFTLFANQGINIVFLALEHSYEVGRPNDSDARSLEKVMPFIGGKPVIPKLLCGISDVVGRLVYDSTEETRAIRVWGSVDEKIACKTRFRGDAFKFPHEEWEPADIFRLICKAHDINPDKAAEKVLSDNEEERKRLKASKGQRTTARVDLGASTGTNSVRGSTNEPKADSKEEIRS